MKRGRNRRVKKESLRRAMDPAFVAPSPDLRAPSRRRGEREVPRELPHDLGGNHESSPSPRRGEGAATP